MNKFLAGFMKFFPVVIAGVVAVEEAIGEASGETKKATVLAGIAAAAKIGAQLDIPTVATISTLIDDVVAAFNKTGFFKKGEPKP